MHGNTVIQRNRRIKGHGIKKKKEKNVPHKDYLKLFRLKKEKKDLIFFHIFPFQLGKERKKLNLREQNVE